MIASHVSALICAGVGPALPLIAVVSMNAYTGLPPLHARRLSTPFATSTSGYPFVDRIDVEGEDVCTLCVRGVHLRAVPAETAAEPVGFGDAPTEVEVDRPRRISCLHCDVPSPDLARIDAKAVRLRIVGFVGLHPRSDHAPVGTRQSSRVLGGERRHPRRGECGQLGVCRALPKTDEKVHIDLLEVGGVDHRCLEPDTDRPEPRVGRDPVSRRQLAGASSRSRALRRARRRKIDKQERCDAHEGPDGEQPCGFRACSSHQITVGHPAPVVTPRSR